MFLDKNGFVDQTYILYTFLFVFESMINVADDEYCHHKFRNPE